MAVYGSVRTLSIYGSGLHFCITKQILKEKKTTPLSLTEWQKKKNEKEKRKYFVLRKKS